MDEKAREQLADQASRMMAAGWRGNPNMSGDDRDFMSPSMRRKHDEKVRTVVDFVLSQVQALSPGFTGSAEGWRDIASAPKDGTPVLVAWAGQPWQPAIAHEEAGLWGVLLPNMSFRVFTVGQPTIWQPLPPVRAMLAAAGERDEAP